MVFFGRERTVFRLPPGFFSVDLHRSKSTIGLSPEGARELRVLPEPQRNQLSMDRTGL